MKTCSSRYRCPARHSLLGHDRRLDKGCWAVCGTVSVGSFVILKVGSRRCGTRLASALIELRLNGLQVNLVEILCGQRFLSLCIVLIIFAFMGCSTAGGSTQHLRKGGELDVSQVINSAVLPFKTSRMTIRKQYEHH